MSKRGVEVMPMGLKSKFEITAEETRELELLLLAAERRNDLRVHRRARGLLLIGRDGMTRAEAAEVCDVNESCLYDWQRRFNVDGVQGLETRKAPGPNRRLSEPQLEQLVSLIQEGPEAAGFDTGVWTTPQIKKMIKREFGQVYSNSYICRILRRLGFSFQLPKIRLARADAEAQRQWREERMPSLIARAEAEDAVIFFLTSPSSSNPERRQERGRGWVKASK